MNEGVISEKAYFYHNTTLPLHLLNAIILKSQLRKHYKELCQINNNFKISEIHLTEMKTAIMALVAYFGCERS